MNDGYIKLWRKITKTSFWKNPNMAHLAIHLLLGASHEPYKTFCGGEELIVDRGSLATGSHKLSDETGLTRQEIRTCLHNLQRCQFLTSKSTNKLTIISICNYSEYQSRSTSTSTNTSTSNQPAINQQLTTIQEVKNIKNIYMTDALFEKLWGLYPRKLGKDKAKEKVVKQIKDENGYQSITRAVLNYAASVKHTEQQYIKHGATFFNKDWKDWVNYSETGKNPDPKPKTLTAKCAECDFEGGITIPGNKDLCLIPCPKCGQSALAVS